MGPYEWVPRQKFDRDKKIHQLPSEETYDHPLKPLIVTVSESRSLKKRSISSSVSSGGSSNPGTPRKPSVSLPGSAQFNPLSVVSESLTSVLDGSDPLSQFLNDATVATDPLSAMAAESSQTKNNVGKHDLDETFEPWSLKKAQILSKYTTSEKLSIATSFLSGGEKVVIKSQASVADKVKTRLEQLDDFEEGSVREMLNLSQQEYVVRIEELNQALIQAWEQDQRVKALKIVIQCAKLLVDTSVIQFYPSKFVLITDILDTFGKLVYNRIRTKAEYYAPGSHVPTSLPENFTPEMVPESAKETCRNWFYKIASIRELIPRLYVETAILRCYSFLTAGEFSQALTRLTRMIRGIGDPLVSAYTRCYLCMVGMSVAPGVQDYLFDNLYDFLQSYTQLACVHVQNELLKQKVDFPAYMTLYSPALDWLLQCIAYGASESTLTHILDRCRQYGNSALLLNSIMTAFKPEYIANRAVMFVGLMRECQDSGGFPKHVLYRTLGLCLIVADPPEADRLLVLNEVWKSVAKLRIPSEYMSCAEVWIEYPVKHFTKREVNTLLGDIIKHMTPDRAFENHYCQLHSVIDRILSHVHDFGTLFAMDKLLPFLDMFQKESVKVDICKLIMDSFMKHQIEPTNDPVIVNAIMFVCKTMHDSVNALTLEDEKRQIGSLICGFVRKVSFGRDFEQQLSFNVEARAAFTNLDVVSVQLIQNVNVMALEVRNVVKGHHTRKTAAFVRACAAFCFITIPSLSAVFTRLELYLLTGQVALQNQCLGQADACFKAAISLIAEVPRFLVWDAKQRSSEPILVSFIGNFLSTLLVVPDHPEEGVLYLLRFLMNVLYKYAWETNGDNHIIIYLRVLALLSATVQETYPYHVEKVDSNDALYGNDPKFIAEATRICQTILDEILTHLKRLGDSEQFKRQSALAFELFNSVILHSDLTNHSMQALAANLWGLVLKNGHVEQRILNHTMEFIRRSSTGNERDAFVPLLNRLQTNKT